MNTQKQNNKKLISTIIGKKGEKKEYETSESKRENRKQIDLKPTVSAITVNVRGLNIQSKRLTGQKQRQFNYILITKDTF